MNLLWRGRAAAGAVLARSDSEAGAQGGTSDGGSRADIPVHPGGQGGRRGFVQAAAAPAQAPQEAGGGKDTRQGIGY